MNESIKDGLEFAFAEMKVRCGFVATRPNELAEMSRAMCEIARTLTDLQRRASSLKLWTFEGTGSGWDTDRINSEVNELLHKKT